VSDEVEKGSRASSILIVDDESSIQKLLKARFSRLGWQVIQAEDGEKALDLSISTRPEVVLCDLRMPVMDGFAYLEGLVGKKELFQECGEVLPSVILMTGHGDKSDAIEAVRSGAFDYLEKPFDMDQLVQSVERANEHYRLRLENQKLLERLEKRQRYLEHRVRVQEESQKEQKLSKTFLLPLEKEIEDRLQKLALAQEASSSQVSEAAIQTPSILIHGESGTGKEVLAREIWSRSSRAAKSFIGINCGAFSDSLLESELFGYEKGAFTGAQERRRGLFEAADGGVLFLDEIAEAPSSVQVRLLRALQERSFYRVGGSSLVKVDVQIIAATHRDLREEVRAGHFREDLFFRLNVVPFYLKPLRERREALGFLAKRLLKELSRAYGKPISGFSEEALEAIEAHEWKGNIRELKNTLEHAVIFAQGERLSLADLGFDNREPALRVESSKENGWVEQMIAHLDQNPGTYNEFKQVWTQERESKLMDYLLSRFEGNVSAIARYLGLDRSNVQRKLKRSRLSPTFYRKAS
jgi:DNA-binding NtrC family response regulator